MRISQLLGLGLERVSEREYREILRRFVHALAPTSQIVSGRGVQLDGGIVDLDTLEPVRAACLEHIDGEYTAAYDRLSGVRPAAVTRRQHQLALELGRLYRETIDTYVVLLDLPLEERGVPRQAAEAAVRERDRAALDVATDLLGRLEHARSIDVETITGSEPPQWCRYVRAIRAAQGGAEWPLGLPPPPWARGGIFSDLL